jgi:GH15 family glucan-1,4-alpha-glucosidase
MQQVLDGYGASTLAGSLQLGVIGNCTFSALIDRHARIVWSCMPRFDGDPVFDALLDPSKEASAWAIEVEGLVRSEQRYEENSAILVTHIWDDKGNCLEVTDFAPRFQARERMFRPLQIVRRLKPVQGHPRITVRLRPRFDWGNTLPTLTRGSHHLRYVGPQMTLRLTTDAPLEYVVAETPFLVDRPMDFILGPDETLDAGVHTVADDLHAQTSRYWRRWTRALSLPLEWQDAVIRAAITLKLSLYEDTGGIIAAMTTSIPEAPGSARNWDYRYCWLRDAFFVVRALNSLSEVATMEDYLRWIGNIIGVEHQHEQLKHVQPLYGIGLEKLIPESIVTNLPGYRSDRPVRLGNQAYEHFQHDVYGNIILAAAQAFHDTRLFRRSGPAEFKVLERMGELAWYVHDKPDAGMWELRTRACIHTSSVLMCWAACDRLAKIAVTLGLPDRASFWTERAGRIRDQILQQAWSDKRQAFAATFGGHELDASVLLMAYVNFIDPRDPRFVSTVEVMEKVLADGPFMRRYEAPDDFGKPETSFNICTFWWVEALGRIGRTDKAREIFEAMLAVRNHLGLLSEDTHPVTGEMWGNFPQTYSMVGVINGAMGLSASWETVI